MTPHQSLTWTAERAESREIGRSLRTALAVQSGVADGEAGVLLDLLSSLERHEYHRSASSRMSEARRLEMWRHRAALAGHDPVKVAQLLDSASQTIDLYWRWLLKTTHREGEGRNTLDGDVLEAIARDPASVSLVERAWHLHAELVRANNDLLPSLLAQLSSSRSYDGPTELSHEAAMTIGALSGMPNQLIEMHRDSRRLERKTIAATRTLADTHQLSSATLPQFHHESHRSSADQRRVEDRRAPLMCTTDAGQPWLVLAAAELNQLEHDIDARALVEAVESLRIGQAPRRNLIYKKARGVWRERIGHRRDESGNAHPTQSSTVWRGDKNEAPLVTAQLNHGKLRQAREAVLLELESVYREMCFDLAVGNGDTVFPTEIYGNRLSREFSADHVRAAFNCLRTLAATATWSDGIVLLPARHGQREFAQHMARSNPTFWGGTVTGRQNRRGAAGSVAFIAEKAVERCENTELSQTAFEIVASLAQFSSVAVIEGLSAMLLRFRLTSTGRRVNEAPTERWFAYVQATITHMQTSLDRLADAPSSAARAGGTQLVTDLAQLAAAFDDFNGNLGNQALADLTGQVQTMLAIARELPAAS